MLLAMPTTRRRDRVQPARPLAATRLKPRIGLSIGVVVERVLAQNAGLEARGARAARGHRRFS